MIDKTRLLKKIGEVPQQYMNKAEEALLIHLDMRPGSDYFL
jgi:mRNA-degrading endonuclease toxin of MazEF toxin-antitoxin module